MTVSALISEIFDRVNSGTVEMTDEVPADLLHPELRSCDVAEYLAKKYDIGREGVDSETGRK